MLPETGSRGVWLTVFSTILVVIVWVLSSAFGWSVPVEVWVSVLGINGAAAVRGGLEHIGNGIGNRGVKISELIAGEDFVSSDELEVPDANP